MNEQVLADKVAQLIAQMTIMQAKVDRLEAQMKSEPGEVGVGAEVWRGAPQPFTKPPTSSRRRMLRRLAGGMLLGVGTATVVGAALPSQAQAGFVRAGGAGAILMPSAGTVSGNLASTTFYGLIATPDSNLNIGVFSAGYKAGVLGYSTSTLSSTFGVFGQSGHTGVYGSGGSIGVKGNSSTGYGIEASSTTGAPFRIVPGADAGPSSGTPQLGDMYVNSLGHLFIYAFIPLEGYGWRKVQIS